MLIYLNKDSALQLEDLIEKCFKNLSIDSSIIFIEILNQINEGLKDYK